MRSLRSQPHSVALKRPRASSAPCESVDARQRKKYRGNPPNPSMTEKIIEAVEDDEAEGVDDSMVKGKGKEKVSLQTGGHVANGSVTVIEELAQELKCGCCTELCYNPVIVNPCQHFFCGSCCILWVRNGGTNCPTCRSISTSVTPSRVLQSMIDLLLRSDPTKARTCSERAQADQVYRAGTALRLPTPRPVTPEPNFEPPNDNFARPCPTCLPGNPYNWRCPIPIQDPAIDPENAFDLDDGTPTGHAFCGNCDQLHNLQAPTSTKCDFCQVSFCGVGIQGRCCALGLLSQQPHAMTDLPDIILSGAIYDSFQGNSVEVDILLDYLRTNDITLRGVYKEIVAYTLQQPGSFASLIETGIFDDLHPVSGGDDPDPTSPRRRICRLCAAQVLIHGFKEWWIRERKHGNLPEDIVSRRDCPRGSGCDKQNDPSHCREFNHIIPLVPTNNLPNPGSLIVFPSMFGVSVPLPPRPEPTLRSSAVGIPLPPPLPPQDDSPSEPPVPTSHPLIQNELAATRNNSLIERSNNMESTSAAIPPVLTISTANVLVSDVPSTSQPSDDIVMASTETVDARDNQVLSGEPPMQPVMDEDIAEQLLQKTSSRTQVITPSPSA